MQFILDNKLKDYIINYINQEQIFAYYLNINESDIQYCLNRKQNRICNPLRNDRSPSLGFNYYRDKLYMYDFANTLYRGDIFYIVGILHGLNSKVNKDFIKICRIIIDNLKLNKIKDDYLINSYSKLLNYNENELRVIKIKIRDWNKYDKKLWNKWSLTINDLSSNYVYPISSFWLDENYYICNDKCYAYLLGKKNNIPLWELYFPERIKKGKYPKFITNNIKHISCLWDLRKTKNLILTKSRKDTILLKKIIASNPFEFGNNFTVLPLGTETVKLSQCEVDALNTLYDHIYIFTDFDTQGISCANYHRKKFGFIPKFLTNGRFNTINYHSKDISDYVALYGFEEGCNLVKRIFNDK